MDLVVRSQVSSENSRAQDDSPQGGQKKTSSCMRDWAGGEPQARYGGYGRFNGRFTA